MVILFDTNLYGNYAGYFAYDLSFSKYFSFYLPKKPNACGFPTSRYPMLSLLTELNDDFAQSSSCVSSHSRSIDRWFVAAFLFSLAGLTAGRSSLFSLLDAQVGYNRDPTVRSVSHGAGTPRLLRM